MNQITIDFHTHTTRSDGAYSPMELCRLARQAGLRVLAITEHNYIEDLTQLRQAFPELHLVDGAELSCGYPTSSGRETELHVVGLGLRRDEPKLLEVLARNQNDDRARYINAILDRLRENSIDLGSYEDLCRNNPGIRHIGRMLIAKTMVERGCVSTVDEAFDIYIGAHGERRAYVPNPLRYVSLEEAVEAILAAGGVAVLAHLPYYQLSPAENDRLLSHFKALTGDRGAMEVYYARYSQSQRDELKALADQHDLMYSAASDFHGQSDTETLAHGFTRESCARLCAELGLPEL